jgi:pimeloyl-ACP methyl ester carboxylesterase
MTTPGPEHRSTAVHAAPVTHHLTARIDGVNIFYREAGPVDAPVVLMLHGFPTSSHMFRNLIPALADLYHMIAPDYPGYGQSDAPDHNKFAYTFDHCGELVDGLLDQLGVKRYAMYVMDYGAPVGWRLALKHPERVTGLIVQNGNAYVEGLKEFWDPIKAYWADHSDARRQALKVLGSPMSPASRPTTGFTTRRCSIVRATPTSSSTCSTTTGPTCRSTRPCRLTSANIYRQR